ncbi:MAG: exonuclease SbcCD subunit D [Firmicutes bacterium]|nr:exonuclease SbcCD subunit D [Bacillota bacterium]
MRFLHISDLHLGKRVNEYSMIEDQAYILGRIADIADEEKPDAVLIAGDVYDRTVPPAEAVSLFDRFLVRLSRAGHRVLAVSGNHDSAERLAFGGRLMEGSGVCIAPPYSGRIVPQVLSDSFGEVRIWMVPFLRPAAVRPFFPDLEIASHTDALAAVISSMEIDPAQRNVFSGHQFVTGASQSGSEEIIVGGEGAVDASVFAPFDYTALGHLHGAQNVRSADHPSGAQDSESADHLLEALEPEEPNSLHGAQNVRSADHTSEAQGPERTGSRPEAGSQAGTNDLLEARGPVEPSSLPEAQNLENPRIRYCGTPLKYSFSEVRQRKSVTIAELGAKGDLKIREVPLVPLRDMTEIRGSYEEVTLRSFYEGKDFKDAYLRITLTDEDDVPDAMAKLRVIYPYLMKLDYDNLRTRTSLEVGSPADLEKRTPLGLFEELFDIQNGRPMSESQRALAQDLIDRIWEEER